MLALIRGDKSKKKFINNLRWRNGIDRMNDDMEANLVQF